MHAFCFIGIAQILLRNQFALLSVVFTSAKVWRRGRSATTGVPMNLHIIRVKEVKAGLPITICY